MNISNCMFYSLHYYYYWVDYRDSNGVELPQSIANKVMVFKKKQARGYIDVWWLYDDGGKIPK